MSVVEGNLLVFMGWNTFGLRMALPCRACQQAAAKYDLALLEADKKWRDLSVSTDFVPGGGSNVYPWERTGSPRS
jgi:hypothetical protein